MLRKITSVLAAGAVLAVAGFVSIEVLTLQEAAHFARPQTLQLSGLPVTKKQVVEHAKKPNAVKAIYMSQCAATSQSFRDSLFKIADETEINSIIVDVKDYSGTIVFLSETAENGGKGCQASDFRELVKEMHRRGIYVIGRVTVFQDPLYTLNNPQWAVKKESSTTTPWTDYKGLSFVDVGAKPFWDYILEISREAIALGVDEINFDYIRYPSDGNMRDIYFEHSSFSDRQGELERFFRFLSGKLRDVKDDEYKPVLSADLFGMTTTNIDDLTIGQVLERAMPYFDYIAPMVYPSHYPPKFNGYANPNDNVYGVVKFSMDRAVLRTVATTTPIFSYEYERIGTSTPAIYKKPAYDKNMMRPWLQDFDYGGNYGPVEVRAQIQATYDAGLNSWMLWDPSNRYTREALESSDLDVAPERQSP
jgi:hypothetical protein